jgi:hypothetical protein
MKQYIITVPVKATQEVLVRAESHDEAKEKVLRGEIERELSELRFEEVDAEGVWEMVQQPDGIKIDLKWSLWSRREDSWGDYAPGAWERLAGMEPGDVMVVNTAPRKEIRFGEVTIAREAEDTWTAFGLFVAHWDSEESLCDTLGVPEADQAGLHDTLPRTQSGEPGLDKDFHLSASTFPELMRLIDIAEDELLKEEETAWGVLEKTYHKDRRHNDP